MISNITKGSYKAAPPYLQAFHKAIAVPAILAVAGSALFLIWHTVIAAPALSFGSPGQVHFAEPSVTAGSEPLLCFDAIVWQRLCPGQTFVNLSPVNVSDRNAKPVDLEPHTISTPTATGPLGPKCRGTKVPAGMAPGVWRLTGHADNVCAMWLPLVGTFGVTVTSLLPSTLVSIKAP